MIAGWATMQALVRQYPDVAFIAHPSMGGAARIAPDLLIGKLFRLLGADAVIFPITAGDSATAPRRACAWPTGRERRGTACAPACQFRPGE